jgi:vacuolar-type H+-ATPase subunit H
LSKAVNSEASALEQVAQHERKLLAKLEEARTEAQSIVEAARVEADRLREKAEADLTGEIAELRRTSASESRREHSAIHQQAEARVAEAQAQARARTQDVAQEAVRRILPGKAEGGT